MRENRTCGSEGGAAELNRSFLPLSRPPRGGDPAPGNGDRPNPLRRDRRVVVLCDACVTPKAFHNIAQGRAAHRRVNGPNCVLTLKELHRGPESSATVLYYPFWVDSEF
jgi:hypothetical protein